MSMRRLWWKSAMLVLASSTTLAFGLGGTCLRTTFQRVLVALTFDQV